MNKNIYTLDTSLTVSGNITTGCIVESKIYAERIDEDSLRKLLFSEKKIVVEKPKTIDQMVTSALNRLHVSIDAEARWASLQITKDFNSLRKTYHA